MKQQTTISQSKFLSLVYHDLFDFPLTSDELNFWQVGNDSKPVHKIKTSGPLFFLPGRQEIVLKRVAASREAEHKYAIAARAANILKKIPTIEFVGITGGLAMGNVQEEDDVDLIIITTQGALWITRLLCLWYLKIKKVPVRRFGEKDVKDKICLNLWLDRDNLSLEGREEIYTAHELLQTRTLFDRGGVFTSFLDNNRWASKFFPQAFIYTFQESRKMIEEGRGTRRLFFLKLISMFELLARIAQLRYMRNKKSREIVEKGRAMLHPGNWNEFIPQVFLARLEQMSKGKKADLTTRISEYKEAS